MATKKKKTYKRAMQSRSAAGMGKSRSPTKKRVSVAGLAGPSRKKAASKRILKKAAKGMSDKARLARGYGSKLANAEARMLRRK